MNHVCIYVGDIGDALVAMCSAIGDLSFMQHGHLLYQVISALPPINIRVILELI